MYPIPVWLELRIKLGIVSVESKSLWPVPPARLSSPSATGKKTVLDLVIFVLNCQVYIYHICLDQDGHFKKGLHCLTWSVTFIHGYPVQSFLRFTCGKDINTHTLYTVQKFSLNSEHDCFTGFCSIVPNPKIRYVCRFVSTICNIKQYQSK